MLNGLMFKLYGEITFCKWNSMARKFKRIPLPYTITNLTFLQPKGSDPQRNLLRYLKQLLHFQ